MFCASAKQSFPDITDILFEEKTLIWLLQDKPERDDDKCDIEPSWSYWSSGQAGVPSAGSSFSVLQVRIW